MSCRAPGGARRAGKTWCARVCRATCARADVHPSRRASSCCAYPCGLAGRPSSEERRAASPTGSGCRSSIWRMPRTGTWNCWMTEGGRLRPPPSGQGVDAGPGTGFDTGALNSARPAASPSIHPSVPVEPTGSPLVRPHRIIAVGGGKGGIGKSLVSSNLGVALAAKGQRVLLVDADLGGANLHTCLGVAQPTATLSDFLLRPKARLEDVILPTGVPNLSLIAGALDVLDAANIKYAHKQRLLRSLQTQSVDYLILDLGAGSSFNTLDFFIIADHGVLVLLPEPTSVENAYRFVKAAFYRRLQQGESEYGIERWGERALFTREGGNKTQPE